jgi:DNA-binding transcriptional MerR regulator
MMDKELTIGETAQCTGLSVDTLRYYERIGLLNPIQRAVSGHRRYTENDLVWIAFLNRLWATGMPVHTMQRYADLRRQGDATLSERRHLLEEHARAIQARIGDLSENLHAIEDKIRTYQQMEKHSHES